MNRFTTNVILLENCNKDWSNVMEEVKDEVKAKEEKEYA